MKKKRYRINFRLSEQEYEEIYQNARNEGFIKNGKVWIAEYLRQKASNYEPVRIAEMDFSEELRDSILTTREIGEEMKEAFFSPPPHNSSRIRQLIMRAKLERERLLGIARKMDSSIKSKQTEKGSQSPCLNNKKINLDE